MTSEHPKSIFLKNKGLYKSVKPISCCFGKTSDLIFTAFKVEEKKGAKNYSKDAKFVMSRWDRQTDDLLEKEFEIR